MTVTLMRYRNYFEAGELDPATGHLRLIAREHREPPGEEAFWEPAIQEEGWFQPLGGVIVSVYRERREAPVLWLQLGAERHPLGPETRSEFEPELDNDQPDPGGGTVLRTFRLFVRDHRVLELQYQLRDTAKRWLDGLNPVPAWPKEEVNYDLLYFAHRALAKGSWDRVLRRYTA
jgi:hypothetical protein